MLNEQKIDYLGKVNKQDLIEFYDKYFSLDSKSYWYLGLEGHVHDQDESADDIVMTGEDEAMIY